MAGAEGFGPSLGDRVAFGDGGQLLIGVADFHGGFLQPGANGAQKVFLDGLFDDDDHGVKSRLMGVIDGVVQNGFSLASHGIDLLQSAVAASHAGGHYNENRFLCHNHIISLILP